MQSTKESAASNADPAAEPCCSPANQETCCEPGEKAGCCDASQPGTCRCR
jgi:hypothetical protein